MSHYCNLTASDLQVNDQLAEVNVLRATRCKLLLEIQDLMHNGGTSISDLHEDIEQLETLRAVLLRKRELQGGDVLDVDQKPSAKYYDTETDCEAAVVYPGGYSSSGDSDEDIDDAVAVKHWEKSRDTVDGIVNYDKTFELCCFVCHCGNEEHDTCKVSLEYMHMQI
jgi:hypothetical protein